MHCGPDTPITGVLHYGFTEKVAGEPEALQREREREREREKELSKNDISSKQTLLSPICFDDGASKSTIDTIEHDLYH